MMSVVPDLASSRMTSRTSLTSSGSRAEVGSSKSRILGSRARARAIADALLLAAGQLARVGVGAVLQTHPVQQFQPALASLGLGEPGLAGPRCDDGGLGDVFQRGQVREQVEVLEHHADLGALLQDFLFAQLVEPAPPDLVAHQCAVDGDEPGVDLFQVVDGAQKGGFAGPGRADDHGDAAGLDRQSDALEDFRGPEGFADLGDLDEAAGGVRGSGGFGGGLEGMAGQGAHRVPLSWVVSRVAGACVERNLRAFCSGVRGRLRTAPLE